MLLREGERPVHSLYWVTPERETMVLLNRIESRPLYYKTLPEVFANFLYTLLRCGITANDDLLGWSLT